MRSASTRSATAAPPASATAARCPSRWPRPSPKATWWPRPCFSGNRNFEGRSQSAGQGQLPGQPAAGRGLRPGRHDRHRPGQRTAGRRQGRTTGLPEGHLAVPAGSGESRGRVRAARDVPPALRQRLRRQRTLERDQVQRRRSLRLGRGEHLHPGAAVPGRPARASRSRSSRSTAPACWPCWAIRSRPTTFLRPARSPRRAPPANTCRNRASSRAISTATARAAATIG